MEVCKKIPRLLKVESHFCLNGCHLKSAKGISFALTNNCNFVTKVHKLSQLGSYFWDVVDVSKTETCVVKENRCLYSLPVHDNLTFGKAV